MKFTELIKKATGRRSEIKEILDNDLAVATFICKRCDKKCNKLEVIKLSKQRTYIKSGCNKCRLWTYWSIDGLKHAPKINN